MFNLIVAVISIALIAAMAAASIFYGGAAFSSSTAQANAATLINNAQQISGAQQLHMIANSGVRNTVGDMTTATTGLVSQGYLQAVPTPPDMASGTWTIADSGRLATITLDATQAPGVCEKIVEQGGAANKIDGVIAAVADIVGGAQFGCGRIADSTAWNFAYKL